MTEGERIGRYLVLKDRDGHMHAVSSSAVAAICEVDDGTLLLLPGGRMLQVERPMAMVLAWLDGRPNA
jgi:hypothetical protein